MKCFKYIFSSGMRFRLCVCVCVCVCVFACSGSCSFRNGSLVEMGGEDLGGASVKKKTIHVNCDIAYTSKGYGLIQGCPNSVLEGRCPAEFSSNPN